MRDILARIVVVTAAFVAGLTVGWLTGLSVSPVAQTVLAGVLAVVAGLFAAAPEAVSRVLVGIGPQGRAADKGDGALGVTLLCIGILIGSSAGIWARTHDLFTPDIASTLRKLDPLGLKRDELSRHLVAYYYPLSVGGSVAVASRTSVLFGGESSEDFCADIHEVPPDDLRTRMITRSERLPRIRNMVDHLTTREQLIAFRNLVCPPAR